jgi:hypothetical protein
MRHSITAVSFVLAIPLSVAACLWDRDTPAEEARGLPEVVAAITGRFPRNPPRYYEMRLERVTASLREHPEDLAGYDDAGVACDRLARGDEAIAWMDKKRAAMERLDATLPERKEHQYRYHANLGTFLVHRWARQGADRKRLDEVGAAREEIAQAMAINPNAHFGREAYQLRALDFLQNPPKVEPGKELPNLLGWGFVAEDGKQADPKEADAAVRGLAGLVVLGNAWESIDIFHALEIALQHDSLGFTRGWEGGRNSLAYLAYQRCIELIDAGQGSMLPGAPKGEDLKRALHDPVHVDNDAMSLDLTFRRFRQEADAWQEARTAYMMSRFEAGRHPDTDPKFWNGFPNLPPPTLPKVSRVRVGLGTAERSERFERLLTIGVVVAAVGLMIGFWAIRLRRGRRKVGQNKVFTDDSASSGA